MKLVEVTSEIWIPNCWKLSAQMRQVPQHSDPSIRVFLSLLRTVIPRLRFIPFMAAMTGRRKSPPMSVLMKVKVNGST